MFATCLLLTLGVLPGRSTFAAEGSVGFAHSVGILPDGTLILGMYGNSDASAVLSSPRWSRIDQVLEFNAKPFPQRNPETLIVDSVSSVTSSADRTLHGFGCKSGSIWLWHSTSDTKKQLLYLTSVNDGLMMIEVKEDNLAEIKNFPEPVLEEEPWRRALQKHLFQRRL